MIGDDFASARDCRSLTFSTNTVLLKEITKFSLSLSLSVSLSLSLSLCYHQPINFAVNLSCFTAISHLFSSRERFAEVITIKQKRVTLTRQSKTDNQYSTGVCVVALFHRYDVQWEWQKGRSRERKRNKEPEALCTVGSWKRTLTCNRRRLLASGDWCLRLPPGGSWSMSRTGSAPCDSPRTGLTSTTHCNDEIIYHYSGAYMW